MRTDWTGTEWAQGGYCQCEYFSLGGSPKSTSLPSYTSKRLNIYKVQMILLPSLGWSGYGTTPQQRSVCWVLSASRDAFSLRRWPEGSPPTTFEYTGKKNNRFTKHISWVIKRLTWDDCEPNNNTVTTLLQPCTVNSYFTRILSKKKKNK